MLPTEGFDYESSTLRRLYELVGDFPDLTLEQARVRIRELPCCTARADGAEKATRSTSRSWAAART